MCRCETHRVNYMNHNTFTFRRLFGLVEPPRLNLDYVVTNVKKLKPNLWYIEHIETISVSS